MTIASEEKKAQMRATRELTRVKRASQSCRVFTLKIQANKLTTGQREALASAFREAKWLRNHIVGLPNLKDYQPSRTVPVRLPDGSYEERAFRFLGSQIRQSVHQQTWQDAVNLAKKKQKGHKVGRLKFKTAVHSLDLKQHGHTYKFKSQSKLKIQAIPGYLRIRGGQQLDGWELANAKLLRKADGYYLAVTAFKAKTDLPYDFVPGTVIGLDMGVKTHITLSDGSEVNVLVGETERLKALQRKLQRQVRGSNRHRATRSLIQREYQKMNNKKDDAANKLVHELLKHELVFMQNEQLASWKKRNFRFKNGRRLQHSILGRVKAKLVHHERVVVLRKNAATTQSCVCGRKNKHDLSQRTYSCACGYSEGRDVHAAQNMVRMGAPAAPVRSQALVEGVSAWDTEVFRQCSVKRGAMKVRSSAASVGHEVAPEASGSSAQS